MKTKTKVYYFISNSDNQIHKTDESDILYRIDETRSFLCIQLLGEPDPGNGEQEILDEVVGYETLGDLYEAINGGGNDLE